MSELVHPGPVLPRWLQRIAWLGILIGGILAYLAVLWALISTENVNFFPALLLIGAITVPMAALIFAEGVGRRLPAPPWSLILTAILGGIVGIVAAGILEYDTMRTLGTVPMIAVGFIEEFAKLILPVLLYLFWRSPDPRAGVVIGVASGMGFATLETMGYGFQALLEAGSIADVDGTLLLRGFLSPACHIAWTGLATAVLWRIRGSRHRGRAVLAFLGTYVAVALLHALWDGSTALPVHVTIGLVGLALLLIFIFLSHRAAPAPAPRLAG